MLFWRRDASYGDVWITFFVACVGIALAITFTLLLIPAFAAADTSSVIEASNPHEPTVGSGWQAGTCKEEPLITDANAADFCNAGSPPGNNAGKYFFEEAGAHPNFGFTQFIVHHEGSLGLPLPGTEQPTNEPEFIRVDLPVGLAVNPGATGHCPIAVFEQEASGCESFGAKVGESGVTASALGLLPITPIAGVTAVPVFNLVPRPGQAARFGLELVGNEVFLEGDIDSAGDYHEGFTITVPHALPLNLGPLQGLVKGLILKDRLVFNGRAGDGTFLTEPSTCNGRAFLESGSQYSTFLKAMSYAEAEAGARFPQDAGAALESPIPPGTSPKNCNTIPYTPSLEVVAGTDETNSPAGAQVTVAVPHIKQETGQDDSTTKEAVVTLPPGMGINPSAAAEPNNLATCDDGNFPLHSTLPITCPANSRIGTAAIASAALPEGLLEGPVFIAKQLSTDPASGNEYRIFLDAHSDRYGIDVRLAGHVFADPNTGQLTTKITEIPQVPFTSFRLNFVGGEQAVLSSPMTCGPNTSAAAMTPWSGNPAATPTSSFILHATPGGGGCASTLAARPFAPSFAAAPKSNKAGAYSPLHITLGRGNGQQELKAATVALAPGMIGKLAGIPYCSAGALAAAAGTSGAAQAAHSSCPAQSEVGVAKVQAGTGPTPLSITGKVFLSGPYHGAPLSLAIVTPATAGPFDLGTVVVRVALFVDPETTQVTAVSDPIPDIFGGAQLSIRQIELNLDRKEFTLNPTSCAKQQSTATLNGGGANPASTSAWSSYTAAATFQTSDCGALEFQPQLAIRFLGGRKATKRVGHPSLQATLEARKGDANIAAATVTLPPSEQLDQSHIKTICTRVQLAANQCPAASVYGYASATSPLLEKELAGPVYLVSSNHTLPDLLADLQGQVDVRLHGVIKSVGKKSRIQTSFAPIPDVPVSKFTLTMQGGKKGLLVNSKDVCAKRYFSRIEFNAQNGKSSLKKRSPLQVGNGCRGVKKHKAHKKKRHHKKKHAKHANKGKKNSHK
ncbi:MAG: hypothetical protein JWO14_979 [Solirubrobacterales bacterium]|nr:hypothetical protein [Solirubrobacterales bacterium]